MNNATAGDTIIVRDGTYNENVDVNVTHLTIRSENGSASTIVSALNSEDHVFDVSEDYVNISGFTVTGATGVTVPERAGIYLNVNVDHCNISYNKASDNIDGFHLRMSSNNTLENNTANLNNINGIHLWYSNSNTLKSNTAYSNNYYGIYLDYSSSNTVEQNTANPNNRYGISLRSSSSNNITCNWVAHNNDGGFRLSVGSTGNNISYNNIMSNGDYNGTSGGYEWNFYNEQSDDVDATNNWWGTNNDTIISASIYDWHDVHTKGNVTFLPKLSEPDPCAPIPELATIVLLSVGLLTLTGYLRIRRKD